jgi:putative ABC transport system permease protein
VVPADRKAGVLLRGRYEESEKQVQLLVPSAVIEELLETMFSVRDYVVLASGGVGVAALATAALVFVLSIRLRRREIETIRKIGGARQRLNGFLAAEVALVLTGGITLAAVSTVAVSRTAGILVRWITG